MTRTIRVTQHRDAEPDYSNEEDRFEMAKMLLQEANLDSTDPIEQVIEASWAAGFNGFDDACLRLLAEFVGLFPVKWVDVDGVKSIHLGKAEDALDSTEENADFWQNGYLVEEAARRAPTQWRTIEMAMERQFHGSLT
tara:strand:+ start:740 stop:1153 length:414 start_codon:yes stop_codon:yes gene_type:complete